MPRSLVLDLPGSCNLRDYGGHGTRDGRRVREGRLLRSGVLHRLTPDALVALEALPLRTVCDLRRTEERRHHPNPQFGDRVRTFEWESSTESSPIRERRFAESVNAEAARAAMDAMYARIPFLLQPRLAGVFIAIANADEGASLVHCSAGKDRTGVAVGLVLDALGVPRETVMADYAHTNEAVDLRRQLLGRGDEGVGIAATAAPILALPEFARAAVLDAHPRYLAAAFAAIESRHGTVERYLIEELNLEPALLDELRGRLLH
jgi:protein-tyrosine phosphatase